ncbi:MAG: hypothetical protein AAF500_22250 [Myxococcota bacterium]
MPRPTTGASLALLASLTACAGVQQHETLSMERWLSASGFQMRLADTPAKLAQIAKLPQRKILTQDHDGQPMYLYADAEDCKCLYAGTRKAYGQYEKLVIQQDEADRVIDAEEALPLSTDPDWIDVDAYGNWAPWW